MGLSYWEKTSFLHDYDICIIGSGIVGLFTALYLKQADPGLKIVVLERGILPCGASTKNAGFVCFGTVSELIELQKKIPEQQMLDLLSKRWRGLQKMISTLGQDAIRLEQNGGFELFTGNDDTLFEECLEKLPYYNSLISEVLKEKETYSVADHRIKEFGFRQVKHLLYTKQEGQINTGQMMHALIRKVQSAGITLFTGIDVEDIISSGSSHTLHTNEFKVNAGKVIIATNAFAKQLLPELDVIPGRGQVMVTKPIKDLRLKGSYHYDKGFYYFRNIDGRVLIGGGRNLDFETEKTYRFGETETVQQKLKDLLTEVILPGVSFEVDMTWSGIMGFGSEPAPIVSEVRPGVFCAVRCNGMGVALGSLIAEEVAVLALNS